MEGLDYLGAGEVWTITDMARIGELVVEASNAVPPEPNQTTGPVQVKAFMGLT
jgi:hypothetical protein